VACQLGKWSDYLFPNASTCRSSLRRTIQNSSTVSKVSEIEVAAARGVAGEARDQRDAEGGLAWTYARHNVRAWIQGRGGCEHSRHVVASLLSRHGGTAGPAAELPPNEPSRFDYARYD
jgi:hypothetical protein